MTAVLEPVALGPTWQKVPNWHPGLPEQEWYVLPELTLGWEILAWIEKYLLNDEGEPFSLTFEQRRFLLHWYAVDEHGVFVYRDGIFQRLKGHGKDPLAAVISCVEFVGPCRFSHWAIEDDPERDLVAGDPVARDNPKAWVQIAAVSRDQTRNTLTIFPSMMSKQLISEHRIDLGKEIIYAYGGQRRIESVTSSPRALEGGRPTFVLRNETHHWLLNNEGHQMAAVIERNATKSKDGSARALSITNAYEPSDDSVAQRQREAWENERAGLNVATGVLYDSLEAPEGATLHPGPNPDGSDPSDEQVKAHLAAIIRGVRGDSVWLNVDRIVQSILDGVNPPSRSRRFWFNQVVAAEDAWLDPAAAKAAVDPLARDARAQVGADQLRSGWLVMPGEEVVLFGDGSKSDDSTALIGCRLSDGYTFLVGVWQRPAGFKGKGWRAPRHEVDHRVREAMERFKVVAFWFDPSHASDDDGTRYWDGLADEWHRLFKDKLEFWSVKTGDRQHSVLWDMSSPERTAQFVAAAETFVEELEGQGPPFEPAFRLDGHPALMDHLTNAKKWPGRYGISLAKAGRESAKKVDAAVCAVGARMLRRLVLNKGLEEAKSKGGQFWGLM